MIRVLGVMTGTSCDGLDAACLEIASDGRFDPHWQDSRPFPAKLRHRVLKLQKPGTREPLRTWLELNRDLGVWYGDAIRQIISSQPPSLRPDAIANHGQTIGHFPDAKGQGFTCQMGDPTQLAVRTGLTVISSFREGDLAAGGQGAPLVPLYHRILAGHMGPEELGGAGIAIHNIGGISNLTYVGPKGKLLAFDTGPGNVWIDAAAELATRGRMRFDRDGRLALSAELDWEAVGKVLKHRFFAKAPPKSTGRDDFPFSLLTRATRAKGASLVATATWVTIESIAQAYERFILSKKLPLQAVLLSGGGAKNRALLEGLRIRLPDVEIATLEETGLDPQYIEAQAFALFGWMALHGMPIGGSWTGAKNFGPPAHIIPGANWSQLLLKLRSRVRQS